MVEIDPRKHDCFRHAVEQRKSKKTNPATSRFLKIFANSGSYGLFVEVTPEKLPKPATIGVFSGQQVFEQRTAVIERQGRWYFPPIAALITAGGRLLLAMLEKCVTDAGGSYLFCDTDSLCIVASQRGGAVKCETANGSSLKALSWKQVEKIAHRFRSLNPYSPDSIQDLLKIEDLNFDSQGDQRKIYGYAISAKRYALYEQAGKELTIVDPKAHGLGYLYPPTRRNGKEPDWTSEAWDWFLRQELGLRAKTPKWLNVPAMMRVVLNTPQVLDRLNRETRPYNFLLCPVIDTVGGLPAGIDPTKFILITPFQNKSERWFDAEYINIHDGRIYQLALRQTTKLDKVVPQTFSYVLRLYPCHPESKSLAPDGSNCSATTRGLLQRASVIAGKQRYVGKETDRRWEHGEDLSLLAFKPLEYEPSGRRVIADLKLRDEISKHGLRKTMRTTGLSQHTLEKICRGQPVRQATLQRVLTAMGR
ncbi:MAG: hypothetical protein LAO55_02690 [Acidobacteriia bacterium]|nr:hypothetical protein [Terriglobia bacterium]